MPIHSPAGPLSTLEEVVAEARHDAGRSLEARYPTPVLLVVAPAEGWTSTTAVKTGNEGRPGSVTMLPTLVVRVERKSSASSDGRITIGRAPVCDLVLPFSALSKVHAYLVEYPPGEWRLDDAGSRNGSHVDGAKALPGQAMPLRDGGTVRFGDVTCKFLLPAAFHADLRRRLER